jgi:hypothetical protein
VAAVFTFVAHLVDVPAPEDGEIRDGVDLLLALAGNDEGPAVILAALLQALGERATVEYGPGLAFVKLELGIEDLSSLPPHAGPFAASGRFYLPLDPRRCRTPLGYLPQPVREAVRGARPYQRLD